MLCLTSIFGQLTFIHTSDTIAYPTVPVVSRYCTIEIDNPTQTAFQFSVIRVENQVVPNWASAICTSVDCYVTTVDSASVTILPGTSEEVKLYFAFFQNTTDTARALFLFRNEQNPSNHYLHNFYGVDSSQLLNIHDWNTPVTGFTIAPNPFASATLIQFPEKLSNETLQILNSTGKVVESFVINGAAIEIERGNLLNGVYFVRLASGKFPMQRLVVY